MSTMTYPINRIEISGSYGLLQLNNIALNLKAKQGLNSEIGTFSFTLPSITGSSVVYSGSTVNDLVKIWVGYNSTGSTPFLTGRIQHITGVLDNYSRTYSGKDLGEILERRLKTKRWIATGASGIVTEIANDLGLASASITSDTSIVSSSAENKRYVDVLKDLNDYWVNAGSQISKDFIVTGSIAANVTGSLCWKTRPYRTTNVETLTTGSNIISYEVTKNVAGVYNKIWVYGAAERKEPSELDHWTEPAGDATDHWTLVQGHSMTVNTAQHKVGSKSVLITADGDGVLLAQCDMYGNVVPLKEGMILKFWMIAGTILVDKNVMLLTPSSGKYFQATLTDISPTTWTWQEFNLGPSNEYSASTNPNGKWTSVGNPDWNACEHILFYLGGEGGGYAVCYIDGLYLDKERYSDLAEDAASQAAYGVRELVVTDDNLKSDDDCERRGAALLSLYKDPQTQITIITPGNTNILVGDRLVMTLSFEGIFAKNYDVISVEHDMNPDRFITISVLTSNERQKEPIATSAGAVLLKAVKNISKLQAGS